MKRTLLITMALAACLVAACASINPFAAAKGADEKAYAVLGTYQIVQGQILKVVNDTTLSANTRRSAAQADAVAFEIIKSLKESMEKYLDAKEQLAAGTTSKERVAIAIANLNDWVRQGQAALADLKKSLATAKNLRSSTVTPFHRLNLGSA